MPQLPEPEPEHSRAESTQQMPPLPQRVPGQTLGGQR